MKKTNEEAVKGDWSERFDEKFAIKTTEGVRAGEGYVKSYSKELKQFITSTLSELVGEWEREIEEELKIQKKVQEKSKEIVVFGRARVAGMVAEKYTRIGKIEALSDLQSSLEQLKKKMGL